MTDYDEITKKIQQFIQQYRNVQGYSTHNDELLVEDWLEREDVRRQIERLSGLEMIDFGSYRIVFSIDETKVLKIDWSNDFEDQNAVEVKVWENANPTLREKLAPILEHGEGWLVMSKTQPFHGDRVPPRLSKLIKDNSKRNFGILDGNIVCHDYGQFR